MRSLTDQPMGYVLCIWHPKITSNYGSLLKMHKHAHTLAREAYVRVVIFTLHTASGLLAQAAWACPCCIYCDDLCCTPFTAHAHTNFRVTQQHCFETGHCCWNWCTIWWGRRKWRWTRWRRRRIGSWASRAGVLAVMTSLCAWCTHTNVLKQVAAAGEVVVSAKQAYSPELLVCICFCFLFVSFHCLFFVFIIVL